MKKSSWFQPDLRRRRDLRHILLLLLHPPPLPPFGVSIGLKREVQQNGSLADG